MYYTIWKARRVFNIFKHIILKFERYNMQLRGGFGAMYFASCMVHVVKQPVIGGEVVL